MSNFDRLIEVMAWRGGEGGCPWDREQTHETLKPYLLEETYEVLEAVDREDDQDLKEELGDVLLQVVFHAQIAREEGRFDAEGVAGAIVSKLIRRHPHVFGDVKVNGAAEVLSNWERLKREERKGPDPSVLDGVPSHLPALLRARRVQEKAARVGFDWSRKEEIEAKIHEEIGEFLDACGGGDREEMENELGDLLFSVVNLARFLRLCPEESLRKTVEKFVKRFRYIERELARRGKEPQSATLAEMDALWEEAKKALTAEGAEIAEKEGRMGI
jgi:tetrapyrrole methylase family protein/MazG family protein